MKIAIAGAGIAGLCLAQGLVRRGLDVVVFESTAEIVRSGFRLHMNPNGGGALRDSLSPEAFELYQQTSRVDPRRELLVFLDQDGIEVGTRPHLVTSDGDAVQDTAVNRRTLRQIMLAGIEDRVKFGQTVVGYEESDSGVVVHLGSGEVEHADVLVGADGIHSAVRAQLLGAPEIIDTGIRSLYARAPLTADVAATLPPELFDGYVFATGRDGRFLTFGVYEPRRTVAEAAAELLPGARIDPVDAFVQVTMNVPEEGPLGYADGDLLSASSAQLKDFAISAVEGWHPALRKLVEDLEVESIFATRFVGLRPVEDWSPGRVTVVGDAVHAMPPSYGAGANIALRDASTLAGLLSDAEQSGGSLVEAIGAYEQRMRGYAYPVLIAALDPAAFSS